MASIVVGVAALAGLGTIGLLIEQHKQDKARIQELEAKLTPWNKGKSGYKQPRKLKTGFENIATVTELAEAAIARGEL